MISGYNDAVADGRRELLALSRLQHSVSDPPPPDGAEVWSRNTAELQTRLLHLLIVSNLLALLSFQSVNSLRDLKRRHTEKPLKKCDLAPFIDTVTDEREFAPFMLERVMLPALT